MRRKGERKKEKRKSVFRRLELVVPTIGTRHSDDWNSSD